MVAEVLVAMDDSELARRALSFALETFPDATITVLYVVGEPSGMLGEAAQVALDDDPETVGERLSAAVFERARELAAEYDAEVRTETAYGRPARAIVAAAEDYDLVVLGSHGGDLASRLFTGNVAETVFRRAPVPVTVVR